MNLPNKLTLLRVIMVPFFVAFLLLTDRYPGFKWVAVAVFIVASLTDLADGKIARKYNLVTNFGKFMDPLADKLLVCSALICLTALDVVPAAITIVIIAREFIISGFRLIAAEKGTVIAASYWGKFKTTFQMVFVIVMMIALEYCKMPVSAITDPFFKVLVIIGIVCMYIALALTIISLIDYLVKNKTVLQDVEE